MIFLLDFTLVGRCRCDHGKDVALIHVTLSITKYTSMPYTAAYNFGGESLAIGN